MSELDADITEANITQDRLLDGRVILRQPRDGFRAGIDSVLLAAAVPAIDGSLVLEPGAGVGAAALCLAARVPGCRIAGLELQPELVRLGRENIQLNGAETIVQMTEGDLTQPPAHLTPGSFDHVMMNPPFLAAGRVHTPTDPSRAMAHVEGAAGLADWLDFALKMLRPKGSVTLIHRADRLDQALAALTGVTGEIVVFPLWPGREGKPAKRVIIRARKDIRAPTRLAPGLVLHQDDGSYTTEADAILRGAPLDL
ncbi:MAG: methyltransferase [Rhodospirillales bacterium]|nr:methyltransferase [Rhodospirillales bacterium]